MATKTLPAQMDVFKMRDAIVDDYKQFATSFTKIAADDIKRKVNDIFARNRYWPDPHLQINPAYKQGHNVAELVKSGLLHPGCAEIFCDDKGESRELYAHQEVAVELAQKGASYVVTSGTGSGKSLCYFLPIVNQLLKERESAQGPRRTRAVIIYPMNALVNSQLDEAQKYLKRQAESDGLPIKVAKYTGDDLQAQRDKIRSDVPDILLTNFMMLEMLMTRQDALDREVMSHCDLRYLVLDELHTYRGRQGADVALLARRVAQKLRRDTQSTFQCIGTSATMSSDSGADADNVIAKVAQTLFGVPVSRANIIREQLERRTNPREDAASVAPQLAQIIDSKPSPSLTYEELQAHPLAIWIETTLGIEKREVVGWTRRRPQTLKEAAAILATTTKKPVDACEKALENFLRIASLPRKLPGKSKEGSFFAFKLHQFLSGAKSLYVTLEAPETRTVTVEGAMLAKDGVRLYPTAFCRECGQEYHAVNFSEADGFLPRELDDAPVENQEAEELLTSGGKKKSKEHPNFGFLVMANNPEMQWEAPDSWLETTKKSQHLTASKKPYEPEEIYVNAAGLKNPAQGRRAYFMPGKFRICLVCGQEHAARGRDATVLATLSAEGRTSATSIITARTLRFMHEPQAHVAENKRKLLAFTDNRQDAALQAGHFNDFAFVTIMRSAMLAVLQETPIGLMDLAHAAAEKLGFTKDNESLRIHWAKEPQLKGRALDEAHRVFEEALALRVVQDFSNTWRYTNPNLLRLKLLTVGYVGLEDLAKDTSTFMGMPPSEYGDELKRSTPEKRHAVIREVLDAMLIGFSVDQEVYGYHPLKALGTRSFRLLEDPWRLNWDEVETSSTALATRMPSDASKNERRELLSAGPRSQLGRRVMKHFSGIEHKGKGDDLRDLIDALMDAARTYGIVKKTFAKNDARGWQLDVGCLQFTKGAGDPKTASYGPYFTQLYRDCSSLIEHPDHPLFSLEAREHTAQVTGAERKTLEERFKFTNNSQNSLRAQFPDKKPVALPLLFCSPTMELGVDISDLDVVYLRNVPPTPANYAQRGGRAGRSGQAALVITYCAAQSPHDQHFFASPSDMVFGEVRPPVLDLTNQQLVYSHGQAVWLASTGQALGAFPEQSVNLEDKPGYGLKADIVATFAANQNQHLAAVREFLSALDPALKDGKASWYLGPDALAADIANSAPSAFDNALNRWRNLVTSAEKQREEAFRASTNLALSAEEQRQHSRIQDSSREQLRLLFPHKNEGAGNDFYIYRYLATEGFLPGYNFPKLPLLAFVPGQKGDSKVAETYIARPKFLGITEFGPHSLIYHSGQTYRVDRVIIKVNRDASPDAGVVGARNWRLCHACGYGVVDTTASVCPGCSGQLGAVEVLHLNHVMLLDNVGTEPRLRITANDETRSRRGFDTQTTYTWAKRHDRLDVRKLQVMDPAGTPVIDVDYGAAAELTRFNKGLRRRAAESGLGFNMDPLSGRWLNNEATNDQVPEGKARRHVHRVIPAVQENKNALVFRPRFGGNDLMTEATCPTIQHALLRAIHRCFELEEGEILAEPLPDEKERSAFLLYESSEGGAGVLSRLAPNVAADEGDPFEALRNVGKKALELLHVGAGESVNCVAGCYRCVLSYYNQPDHARLDRRDSTTLAFFKRLTQVATVTDAEGTVQRVLEHLTTTLPPVTDAWKARARSNRIPEPDRAPLAFQSYHLPLVWNAHRVVALLDNDPTLVRALESRGYAVVQFAGAESAGWDKNFQELLQALGGAP